MNEFEIGGRQFQVRKIDAFKQFHIVRRIGPILADLLPAMQAVGKVQKSDLTEEGKLDELAKLAAPLMTGLAKLSDSDADYVLYGLLAAVEMKQMPVGNWAKIHNGSMLMIQDLDLPTMLQAAGRAFMFNLSGFFAVLPRQP